MLQSLATRDFLIAALAAVSLATAVFTVGASLVSKSDNLRQRIKRVALEREKLRAEEVARLRGRGESGSRGTIRHASGRQYVQQVVDRFSLQKLLADEGTTLQLANAGLRGQSALNTFVFARFVTPFALFLLSWPYFQFTLFKDRPTVFNFACALFIGLVGAYLPTVLLKNRVIKRQTSIRRAWPDALDLILLCVESGMSIEHAFKRVANEVGIQSPELAEEITLTTAELSFLEDRTRAYENLGKRTGLDLVKSVMTALIQAERYGTSVGSTLRVMAEESRELRMLAAEKKAAALPPKLTVPMILCFLPVLFIVIIAPAIIKLIDQGAFDAFGSAGG